ncbi:MAG TPA: hypothetical protein VLZ89_18460 [Anaerolineales bacterium]|nr:hypothetical protein [Anaerolineales bacterium]
MSLVFLLVWILTGCAGQANDSLLAVPTATETPQPTPTIVWFPASATPLPQELATQVPTPDQKPGIGAVRLTDDFSSAALWTPASSDEGSAVISGSGLTLAVPPGSSILRLRPDLVLSDFYAEITASPSLCRGQDEYGLDVRASFAAYYRLVLLCNGTLRLDRVGSTSHQLLQPPLASGDVPTGAPGEVRMGVWAVGPDLRFFLNGRYQFSVNDKNYLSGTIGVFAHSVADTPVAVTFSNLTIYDVNYSPPTKTPQP